MTEKERFIALFGNNYNEFWTTPEAKRTLDKLLEIEYRRGREEAPLCIFNSCTDCRKLTERYLETDDHKVVLSENE